MNRTHARSPRFFVGLFILALASHAGAAKLGATASALPVTVSFVGAAFSEPRTLGFGYAFEQATRARIKPKTTPPLTGESIRY